MSVCFLLDCCPAVGLLIVHVLFDVFFQQCILFCVCVYSYVRVCFVVSVSVLICVLFHMLGRVVCVRSGRRVCAGVVFVVVCALVFCEKIGVCVWPMLRF